jgi:hypothetical protein
MPMPDRLNVQSKQNIDSVDQHERENDYFIKSEIGSIIQAVKNTGLEKGNPQIDLKGCGVKLLEKNEQK